MYGLEDVGIEVPELHKCKKKHKINNSYNNKLIIIIYV